MCTSMRSQAKPDSSVPPADLFSSLVSYRRNCRGSGRTYLHCIDGRPACLRQCLWSLWHTDVSKYATFGIPKSSSLLRGSSGRFIWANDRNYHGLLSDAASSPTETGPRGRSDRLNVGTSIHIDYRNLCRGSTVNDFVSPESGKPQHSGANTSTLPLIYICHCHHAVINCSTNWFVFQNAMLADLALTFHFGASACFFSLISRGDTLNAHPCGLRGVMHCHLSVCDRKLVRKALRKRVSTNISKQ